MNLVSQSRGLHQEVAEIWFAQVFRFGRSLGSIDFDCVDEPDACFVKEAPNRIKTGLCFATCSKTVDCVAGVSGRRRSGVKYSE